MGETGVTPTTRVTDVLLIDRSGRHRVLTIAGHPVVALPETIDHRGALPPSKPGIRVEDGSIEARFIRTQIKDDEGRTVYIQRW